MLSRRRTPDPSTRHRSERRPRSACAPLRQQRLALAPGAARSGAARFWAAVSADLLCDLDRPGSQNAVA
jgi:hypothetical protein